MPYSVTRCILCGRTELRTVTCGSAVHGVCAACGAEFQIEFDPPDEPRIRGRITILRDPTLRPDSADADDEESSGTVE
jgi:hypothetical protein